MTPCSCAGQQHGVTLASMRIVLTAAILFAPLSASGGTLALSPAEAEAAKEAGARLHARDEALSITPSRDRAVHGEVGVTIGTGGYRALYGTALAPLGENGILAISIAQEQYGRTQRTRYGPR